MGRFRQAKPYAERHAHAARLLPLRYSAPLHAMSYGTSIIPAHQPSPGHERQPMREGKAPEGEGLVAVRVRSRRPRAAQPREEAARASLPPCSPFGVTITAVGDGPTRGACQSRWGGAGLHRVHLPSKRFQGTTGMKATERPAANSVEGDSRRPHEGWAHFSPLLAASLLSITVALRFSLSSEVLL